MSSRKKPDARCPTCRQRREICLCADIAACRADLPSISSRVLVLMHYKEERLTTNTGRLAAQAIPGCEIRLRGRVGVDADVEGWLRPGRVPLLLYPGDDVEPIDRIAREDGPFDLIVPDGSWRQASKVAKREAALAGVRRVGLAPNSAPTRYFLRDEPKAEGLATFEAIARCLGALEGSEVQRRLEALFDKMVAQTLRSRGVTGI